MDARALARRLAPGPALHLWRRGRSEFQELRAPVRTIHRPPPGNGPPPRRAYAAFGEGSWVVPPARVLRPERVTVGDGTVVMEHSTLWVVARGDATGLISIGNKVTLARFNTVVSAVQVVIEDGVASSDSVSILDTWDHPLRPPGTLGPDPYRDDRPVVIETGAYLACNSIIGPGVRVGRHAYVGECAVVLDDVPPYGVVYGNPARLTRRFDPDTETWETF